MIGVLIRDPDIQRSLDQIVEVDAAGVPAAWLTTVGAGRDALQLFAAAAVRTSQIKLGTAIIPISSRHPLALAQQAQVVEALAPGRLLIGLGPNSTGAVETMYGIAWDRPLSRLREYTTILKTILQTGAVDFTGEHYSAHTKLAAPSPAPVYVSALRTGAFRLAGEVADGVITWVAPWSYVEAAGLPALRAGAEKAGRPTPELIYHVPVCITDDRQAALDAAAQQLGNYANIPAWSAMYTEVGLSPKEGANFFDNYLISGTEAQVASELRGFKSRGASQVIADPITVRDKDASLEAALKAIAAAN